MPRVRNFTIYMENKNEVQSGDVSREESCMLWKTQCWMSQVVLTRFQKQIEAKALTFCVCAKLLGLPVMLMQLHIISFASSTIKSKLNPCKSLCKILQHDGWDNYESLY